MKRDEVRKIFKANVTPALTRFMLRIPLGGQNIRIDGHNFLVRPATASSVWKEIKPRKAGDP